MVNIKPVSLCPNRDCGAELPYPVPDTCPACNYHIKPAKNPYFATPDFLTFQMDDYRQSYDEDSRGADAKPLSPSDKKKFEDIKKQLVVWARECPTEDKLAALSDAHLIMRHALYAVMDGDALKSLIDIGKQIGKMAEAADNFIRSGGALYEPETRPVPADYGSDGGGTQAVGRSGDSP